LPADHRSAVRDKHASGHAAGSIPHNKFGPGPAEAARFDHGRLPPGGPAADLTALSPDRTGEDWIARKVGPNGVVCVSWQQVSVGKHYAGHRCDVHVGRDLLQFWVGAELLKTVARTSSGEVRKKNAARV
jgi:hypothetical protein